jgi:hypothetical protein
VYVTNQQIGASGDFEEGNRKEFKLALIYTTGVVSIECSPGPDGPKWQKHWPDVVDQFLSSREVIDSVPPPWRVCVEAAVLTSNSMEDDRG